MKEIQKMSQFQTNKFVIANGDIAIDFDEQSVKTYVRISMLHINALKREIRYINNVLMSDNMPDTLTDQQAFFKKLAVYEEHHGYQYTAKSTYKTIGAIKIELLLPRKLRSVVQKRKVIHRFMKRVNPIGYAIPWTAYEKTRGTAHYINILLSEREYLDHVEVKRYNRNYRDQNGNITHKKGDIVRDKAGNPIKEHFLFGKKTRLFCFRKQSFGRMVKQLVDHYVAAVKSVLEKINTRFVIKKKTANGRWHYFNRKVCQEINVMKQYVEFYCNYAVLLMKNPDADLIMSEYRGRSAPVPKMKEIMSVFYKYKKRFEKESFHDSDGKLRKIAYKRVSLPTLETNLDILKREFQQELMAIVPKVFQG